MTHPSEPIILTPEVLAFYQPDAVRLTVEYVRQTRMVSSHVGGRGDLAFPVEVVGVVNGQEITRHDYSGEIVLECTCAAFEAGQPCQHIKQYEAAELPALVAA